MKILISLFLAISLQGCMLMMPSTHGMMNHGNAATPDSVAIPGSAANKPANATTTQL